MVRHNKNADAILGNRASYAHALSPVERVSCVRPGSLLVGHRSHECSQYMCMTMNDFPVIGDLVMRTGSWDRQGANIRSRYKEMYGVELFLRLKPVSLDRECRILP